jgi:O-antigen/teichoic acid export membrane protein
MIPEARATVRNVSFLLAQQGLFALGSFVFAAMVPRLMGPQVYGRYALITSLSIWLMLFSGLGFTQVIGRYVPQFVAAGEREPLKFFMGDLLKLRTVAGLLVALLYLGITLFWLRDLDPLVLAFIATAIWARTVSNLLFSYFLGINQAARWGLADILRRWISLGFLVPGFYVGGLKGACLGVLLAELTILAIGIRWTSGNFSWSGLKIDWRGMAPYVSFGLIFFGSDLLRSTLSFSGESMVRAITGDYVQVSYYGVAFSVYFTIAVLITQVGLSFAPLLVNLWSRGDTDSVRAWIERLIKCLAMGGVIAVWGLLLLGDNLVPLVLGRSYHPVAANLLPLLLTLLANAVVSVGSLLALICNRPKVALAASGLQLAAFWGLGPLFIHRWESFGGCLAVLAATILSAAYLVYRLQPIVGYSLKRYAWVIGLGGVFAPLCWWRSSWEVNLALFGIFVVAYSGVLLLLRIITREEITTVWEAIKVKGYA